MVRWHEDEAELDIGKRRPSTVGCAKMNRGRGGNNRREWKETRPRECGEGGEQEEQNRRETSGGRKYEGDGRQGSKAPGRLFNRK